MNTVIFCKIELNEIIDRKKFQMHASNAPERQGKSATAFGSEESSRQSVPKIYCAWHP